MIVLNDNRMIFPVLTEKHPLDYLASVCKVNRKGKDVHPWVMANLTPHEIRKELRELNLPENSNRVLVSYRLNENICKQNNLERNGYSCSFFFNGNVFS